MKRVTQILIAIIVSLGVVNAGNIASACSDITIINTGPNSQNQVVCVDTQDITITCTNNIFTGTANIQTGQTGGATGSGNTTIGDIATGTVVNYNGVDVTIGVTGCLSTPAPTTPTTTPETPNTPPVVVPAAVITEKPATLPYTASSSLNDTFIIAVIALATIALTIRLAVSVYRRATLK